MLSPEIISAFDATRDLSQKPFRSLCYAPYVHVVFDTIGRVRACCTNFEYPLGDLMHERFSDIWKGERIEKLRTALRNNDMSLGCLNCHSRLSLGIKPGTGRSVDHGLMINRFEQYSVEENPPYWPKHMEFHLSNRCNLECVMCFGEFSHLIRKNRDQLPPYPDAYGEEFFADIHQYLFHLKSAQFLGGEPFLIPAMYRIWDMLIEEKLSPGCHVTTNGTVWNEKVERIFDSLPMSASVSLDGSTKEVYEAIRVNANFERVVANLRRIREICYRKGLGFTLNFTLQKGNWHNLVDFLLFAENEGVPSFILTAHAPTNIAFYGLPIDELRSAIHAIEVRAEEVAPKLTINRASLDVILQELRGMLASTSQRELLVRDVDLGSIGNADTVSSL